MNTIFRTIPENIDSRFLWQVQDTVMRNINVHNVSTVHVSNKFMSPNCNCVTMCYAVGGHALFPKFIHTFRWVPGMTYQQFGVLELTEEKNWQFFFLPSLSEVLPLRPRSGVTQRTIWTCIPQKRKPGATKPFWHNLTLTLKLSKSCLYCIYILHILPLCYV